MAKRLTFQMVCAHLAARRCYEGGQTVAEIAASAKKTPATIRKWIEVAGGTLKRRTHAQTV